MIAIPQSTESRSSRDLVTAKKNGALVKIEGIFLSSNLYYHFKKNVVNIFYKIKCSNPGWYFSELNTSVERKLKK